MKRLRMSVLSGLVGLGLLALAACQNPTNNTSTVATTPTSTTLSPQDFTTDASAPASPAIPSALAFVDNYKTNQNPTASTYNSESTNAALALLSKFDDLWTSGGSGNSNANSTGYATAYKNGTIKNSAILSANITYAANATANRTSTQADNAYYDDRRGKTYSTISGFGPLASYVYTGTGISTSITSIPSDATTYGYSDSGNDYSSSNITSSNGLYNVIALIKQARTSGASANPAKFYFNYPRPWRLANDSTITETAATSPGDGPYYASSTSTIAIYFPTYSSVVSVVPALKAIRSTTPETDGGFPSGHTSESFNTGLLMAYAIPERFLEIVTRSSDLGQNRILAGQHSPLDVMGGRMLATALSAAGLYDSANATYKAAAFTTAHTYLEAQTGTTDTTLYAFAHSGTSATDPFYDRATNKANYLSRLTYGFSQIGTTGVAATVPKGAEVLLETRFPYLDAGQRREILRTTAIDSGYPLLDDAEGWGRLNLCAAGDGFGRFDGTIYANLDATQVSSTHNGFYASDIWGNDISGSGRLVKQGTGTLKLIGKNTYSGGTRIEAGVLEADTTSACGSRDVYVSGGALEAKASSALGISGYLTVKSTGGLILDLGTGTAGLITVGYTATLDGTLTVNFSSTPASGSSYRLVSAKSLSGKFSSVSVKVNGTTVTTGTVTYDSTGCTLTF